MNKNYLVALLIFISSNVLADDLSFGLGLGVPYGLFGVNMNYKLNDTFDATAGIGVGYGAGVRYHPISTNEKVRLTAFYGTNMLLKKSTSSTVERFNGINIGIGYGALSDGWDVDLIYVFISQEAKDRVAELKSQGYIVEGGEPENQFTLSVGYHW